MRKSDLFNELSEVMERFIRSRLDDTTIYDQREQSIAKSMDIAAGTLKSLMFSYLQKMYPDRSQELYKISSMLETIRNPRHEEEKEWAQRELERQAKWKDHGLVVNDIFSDGVTDFDKLIRDELERQGVKGGEVQDALAQRAREIARDLAKQLDEEEREWAQRELERQQEMQILTSVISGQPDFVLPSGEKCDELSEL